MTKQNPLAWGNLLHLSFNMWQDHNGPNMPRYWADMAYAKVKHG